MDSPRMKQIIHTDLEPQHFKIYLKQIFPKLGSLSINIRGNCVFYINDISNIYKSLKCTLVIVEQ